VANALQETRFLAIHASDLQRTMMTAEAIQEKQKDSLIVIPSQVRCHLRLCETMGTYCPLEFKLLREQNFGSGEGKPFGTRKPGWTPAQHFEKGVYPSFHDRHIKFPGGESKDEMAARALQAVDEIFLPYASVGEEDEELNVAIVSHGLFIRELVSAFLRRGIPGIGGSNDFHGLKNTAWVRLKVVQATEVQMGFFCVGTELN
jgi:broad specificity phosphatase PhoE